MTSTIGARHSGHLPTPWSNSLAHFEQVHICPHLTVRARKIYVKNELLFIVLITADENAGK